MPNFTVQGKTLECPPSADLRQVLLAHSIPYFDKSAEGKRIPAGAVSFYEF